METDIYEKLAKFLDALPAGYPRSENGVELRILRHLFTPEEASLALHLALISEEARVIAIRAGLPLPEVERILGEMSRKRLIYSDLTRKLGYGNYGASNAIECNRIVWG